MPRRIYPFGIVLLALALIYTLASGWITMERITRLHAAGNATARSQEVLSALHAFATAAVDIESGSRGYALTGNEAYLQPFEQGRRQAPERLDQLRDLLRNDPPQLALVERLTPLLAERIAIAEHGIEQKRSAPDQPYLMRFGTRGRESIDEIRRIVDDIEADERHDVALRKAAWHAELERTRTTEALSALLGVFVIGLSFSVLLRLWRTDTSAREPDASDAASAKEPRGRADDVSNDTAARDGANLASMLRALADAKRRDGVALSESIDAGLPALAPSSELLLYRIVDRAASALRHCGEIAVVLAARDAAVALRIDGAIGAKDAFAADAEASSLEDRVKAAGGDWLWRESDGVESLAVALPALAREADDSASAAGARPIGA